MSANAVIDSNDITTTTDKRWNIDKKYVDICCSQCVVLGVIGFALQYWSSPFPEEETPGISQRHAGTRQVRG